MKKLHHILLCLSCVAILASCKDEIQFAVEGDIERVDNMPIDLRVTIDGAPDSRDVDHAKKNFSSGDTLLGIPADIIHVQSTFKLDDGSSQTRYCALKYTDEGKWVPMGNGVFAWPNRAVTGQFTAYYIYGSTGALTGNNAEGDDVVTTTRTLFTEIIDGQDPLRADPEENVRYGHTVELRFKHILTHLTLIELDAGIDESLIFTIEPDVAASENKHRFNNAFQISLDTETNPGVPNIKFEYLTVPQPFGNEGGKSFIQAPTQRVRDKETRIESSQVGFFLEPGCFYNAFSIYYSNYDLYLSYVNSDLNNREKILEGNNRYTFNVKKSAGITVSTPPEERWDESEDYTTVIDTEAFLRAVNTNSKYKEWDDAKQDSVLILEATSNPSGTMLMCNIRFKNPYYHVFPHPNPTLETDGTDVPYDFVPTVGGDNVFDGGYHYIKDLKCPLFYANYGTIKNLGISNFNIGSDEYGMWESSENLYKDAKVAEDTYVNAPYEYKRTGAIANNNMGTVQNIRVKDITVNVGIHVTKDNQEAHSVGALFGINNSGGFVDEVYLSGKITVNVQNFTGTNVIPEVSIGGLTGQNLGTLTNIEQLVDNRANLPAENKPTPVNIIVNNNLDSSSGAYYVGGLSGNNTGMLNNITLPTLAANGEAVLVDCSRSHGVVANVGGVVGKADSSQGNQISSCLVASGTVKAGTCSQFEAISPFNYVGGIVGELNERTNVLNCTSFISVFGSTGTDNVTRAVGGVFGAIVAVQQTEGGSILPGQMMAIAAYGDELEGTNAGCFVGEAPTGKVWSDYENFVDVKKFPYIDYIGTNTKPY